MLGHRQNILLSKAQQPNPNPKVQFEIQFIISELLYQK